MSNYRKKDVISDQEIDAFETIEINKIKVNTIPKKRRKLRLVLIVPALLLAFILGVNLLGGERRTVNPALEGFELAELSPISLSDLPEPLQGVTRYTTHSNLMFLSNIRSLATTISFEDEPDVTGEGQLRLEEIIEDTEMLDEANKIFNDLHENIMYLTLDEVASFDENNEYFFVVNEDGTYTLTLIVNDNGKEVMIEAKTFYQAEEFFYQATYQVDSEEETAFFKIIYNQDNTKKYQYARHNYNGQEVQSYVSVEQLDEYTNVVAMNKFDNVEYEIVANANDDHGVIFIAYESEEGNRSSVEYYNADGALLKHEWGVESLSIFNQFLDNLFNNLEMDEDVTLRNLSEIIPSFAATPSFTIEVPLSEIALATTTGADALLIIDETTSYTINYTYDSFFYTKEGSAFVSGDTIYQMTSHVVEETTVIVTYSALYQLPEAEIAANGESYYLFNRYMAKYIEAAEGYSIVEKSEGHYHLVNDALSGSLGDHIDIDIKVEDYYIDGEPTPATYFEHTCDIQFENIIFTEMDDVNAAKTNLDVLYEELVPSESEINEQFEAIDLSMFE